MCVFVTLGKKKKKIHPTSRFVAAAVICLSVCQSCRRPLRSSTTTRMASSITKISQTAWGPWATCLQRWSSSRSSSKSRWDVRIYLVWFCVCLVFISSSVVKAWPRDWWVFPRRVGVNAWVMCVCGVCVAQTRVLTRVLSYESVRNWCLSLDLGTLETF